MGKKPTSIKYILGPKGWAHPILGTVTSYIETIFEASAAKRRLRKGGRPRRDSNQDLQRIARFDQLRSENPDLSDREIVRRMDGLKKDDYRGLKIQSKCCATPENVSARMPEKPPLSISVTDKLSLGFSSIASKRTLP